MSIIMEMMLQCYMHIKINIILLLLSSGIIIFIYIYNILHFHLYGIFNKYFTTANAAFTSCRLSHVKDKRIDRIEETVPVCPPLSPPVPLPLTCSPSNPIWNGPITNPLSLPPVRHAGKGKGRVGRQRHGGMAGGRW